MHFDAIVLKAEGLVHNLADYNAGWILPATILITL
jgi:hypothetical protein